MQQLSIDTATSTNLPTFTTRKLNNRNGFFETTTVKFKYRRQANSIGLIHRDIELEPNSRNEDIGQVCAQFDFDSKSIAGALRQYRSRQVIRVLINSCHQTDYKCWLVHNWSEWVPKARRTAINYLCNWKWVPVDMIEWWLSSTSGPEITRSRLIWGGQRHVRLMVL